MLQEQFPYKFNPEEVVRETKYGLLITDTVQGKVVVGQDKGDNGNVKSLSLEDCSSVKSLGYSAASDMKLDSLQLFLKVHTIDGVDHRLDRIELEDEMCKEIRSFVVYNRDTSLYYETHTKFVVYIKKCLGRDDEYVAICIDNDHDGHIASLTRNMDIEDEQRLRIFGLKKGFMSVKNMWKILNPVSVDGEEIRPDDFKQKLPRMSISYRDTIVKENKIRCVKTPYKRDRRFYMCERYVCVERGDELIALGLDETDDGRLLSLSVSDHKHLESLGLSAGILEPIKLQQLLKAFSVDGVNYLK
jgi:hypothetical protein